MFDKKQYDILARKIELASSTLKDLKELQQHMRNVCEHQWLYTGHSHNDSCYECKVCGEIKWE